MTTSGGSAPIGRRARWRCRLEPGTGLLLVSSSFVRASLNRNQMLEHGTKINIKKSKNRREIMEGKVVRLLLVRETAGDTPRV